MTSILNVNKYSKICIIVFFINLIFLRVLFLTLHPVDGGSIAEWLACRTQARKNMGSNRSRDAVG